ncbi:MAG: helicase-exonuclease AddAB subunit AddA [Bacillota bacterium]|nr:helicase-exonuclease AddAB subunit AddA [Bacillota bacterium]
MTNWTDQQSDAIYKRDANILVSAAAGSGKTAVLTERIVELLEQQKIDINQLLVFTFSRMAANEMKERVYKKIIGRLKKKGYEDFYRRQLIKINQANITTIHSFCNDVVKSHFFMLGLDPDFRIGEDNDFNSIKETILDEIFEIYYADEDKDFEDLIEVYSNQRGDRKLRDLVFSIHRKTQAYPDVDEWIKDVLVKYSDEKYWNEYLKEHMISEMEKSLRASEKLWDIVENETESDKYREFFSKEIENIKENYFALIEDINKFQIYFGRLPADKSIDKETKERIKKIRDFYKGIINGIYKTYFVERDLMQHRDEFMLQLNRVEKLIEMIKEFDGRLLEHKKENNILEFSDLEHFALQILKDPAVGKAYQEQFAYIFVDEYQDSNYIQEAIIQRIKGRDNLFMVGDLKQSIYKFRLAEPSIFLNKYKAFSKNKNPMNHKIDLNMNFRSRGNVLTFINYIFEGFMTEKFGGMDYNDQAKLYLGKNNFENEDSHVEINLVNYTAGKLSKEALEIYEIGKRIKRLVNEDDVNYKDIVILMRSPSSYIEEFSRIFEKLNLPLFIGSTDEYIDTLEVDLILNYLKVVDNPRQDIPMLSLLRSPIYDFSDEELYQIRKECSCDYYHECLFEYQIEDEVKEKIDKFLSDVNKLREFSRFLTIDNLIWTIFIQYNFQEFFVALPKGDRRSANIRKLMDIASEFQIKDIVGLSDFNHYMNYLKEKEAKFSSAKIISDQSDVVRLMSIHKSKGLEFPVVILAGTGKKFNKMDSFGDVIIHNKFGIIPKYFDKENRIKRSTFHRDIVSNKIKTESSEEELRILYVALTRAVDRLIVFGGVSSKNFEDTLNNWREQINFAGLENNDRFIDWIMFNIYNQKVYDKPLFEINTILANSEDYEIGEVNISDLSKEEFVEYLNKEVFEYNLDIELPREHHVFTDNIQSKITVTDIAHNRLNPTKEVETVKAELHFSDKKTDDAAKTGIEIHKIMQMLKLKELSSYDDFKIQVHEMIDRKIISKNIQDSYDIKKVYMFFETDVGKRLLNSSNVKREEEFVLSKKSETIDGMTGEGDILIQGIIDCYFEEDDHIVLIDFKSDFVTEENYTKSLKQYSVQLDYYALAIESLVGKKVKEKYIHFFNINKNVKIS